MTQGQLSVRRALGTLFGLALSTALLVALYRQADPARAWQVLGQGTLPWLLATLPCTALALMAQSVRAQVLLRPMAQTSLWLQLRGILVGFVGNAVLPFRLGEAARTAFLSRTTGVPAAAVLTVIVVERLLDVLFLAIPALLLVPMLSGTVQLGGALLYLCVGLGLGLSALFLAARSRPALASLVRKLTSPLPGSLAQPLRQNSEHVLSALQVLQAPRAWIVASAATLVTYICTAAMAVAVLQAYDAMQSWIQPLAMTISSTLALTIPSAPGAVGTHHWANTQVLIQLGLARHIALAVAVAFHFMAFVPLVLAAMPLVLRDLARELPRQR